MKGKVHMSEVKVKPLNKVGDKETIDIQRLGINGEGVGYLKGQVVFVDGGLPKEKIVVEATDIYEKYAKAKIYNILERSDDRIIPYCQIYRKCGGCSLQHINYKPQLEAKRELVKEAFLKYFERKHKIPQINSVLGMKKPWHYRNKVQIPLTKKDDMIIAGLYKAGTNTVIEMDECKVHHPDLDKIVNGIKEMIDELNISVYNPKKRKGQIRHIVARISFATKDVQVTLVTATDELEHKEELITKITESFPQIVSVFQNINKDITSLVMGDEQKLLWGDERIYEKLGDIEYALSPRTFFQLNPSQTEVLYEEIAKAANLTGKEKVLDAYCGAGTIGLWLAESALEVKGIEESREAVKDAKYNAYINEIKNVHFTVGTVERVLPKWISKGYETDIVIVDPPRTGCGEDLLAAISKVNPKKIIYVSCNPATLAKDCKYLLDNGYIIDYVQPVDMFPQTSHVECVVLMSRK